MLIAFSCTKLYFYIVTKLFVIIQIAVTARGFTWWGVMTIDLERGRGKFVSA